MKTNPFLNFSSSDKKDEIKEESDPISSLFGNRRKFIKTTGVIAGGIMLNQTIMASKKVEAATVAPTIASATSQGSGAITFNWNAVSGATGYKIYYGTSSGNYSNSIDLGNVTSKSFSRVPTGFYYVAFTSYDSSSESGFSIELVFAFTFVPPSVIGSAVNGSTVYFIWNAVNGAAGYKIHLGLSRNYVRQVDLGNVTSISFNVASGTLHVAFTAYKSDGTESNKSAKLVIIIP